MIDKSTDDQSCLAMFVPPKATDIIEESNWGNDASMNYFMSESKSKSTSLITWCQTQQKKILLHKVTWIII